LDANAGDAGGGLAQLPGDVSVDYGDVNGTRGHHIATALDRLETYLGRVRAALSPAATGRDIYQAMSDTAELSEIARRLYVTLGQESHQHAHQAKTNTR
jgi:hypothetical protein